MRYAGVSNYCGWRIGRAATWQRAVPGRAPIVANQVRYSLLDRGIEREVVPACRRARRRHLPVVAAGRRRADRQVPRRRAVRLAGVRPDTAPDLASVDRPHAAGIVEAVATAADGLATSPVAVALAWLRDRPGVTAPVLGARTLGQLDRRPLAPCERALDAAADEIQLTCSCDDVYAPRRSATPRTWRAERQHARTRSSPRSANRPRTVARALRLPSVLAGPPARQDAGIRAGTEDADVAAANLARCRRSGRPARAGCCRRSSRPRRRTSVAGAPGAGGPVEPRVAGRVVDLLGPARPAPAA